MWSRRRDSNPRPPAYKAGALGPPVGPCAGVCQLSYGGFLGFLFVVCVRVLFLALPNVFGVVVFALAFLFWFLVLLVGG